MKVKFGLRTIVATVFVVAAAFLGVFLGFGGQSAVAEGVPDYRIQISPAITELDLSPGKTTVTKFRVQNTGAKRFDFQLLSLPYSVSGEDYEQSFSNESNYTSLANWIEFSQDSGSISPDNEAEITITIDVPKDIPEGGQYAAVMARMIEPEQQSDISGITALKQVGMLVYSKNVEGNTRKEGEIVENKVPSFMFAPPIQATSIVSNTGNVHADATYILQVFPFFGDEEIYTNEEHPETRTILPETRRLNTMSWDGAPQLGLFRVKQTVKFLDKTSVTEKVVFICPLWFLFIILAIIFLAIFWIVSRIRSRKKED